MKHTKLVDELNSQLALASEAQQSHHATRKMFFEQIGGKEQGILRKLKR
ncbi:MAG: hypothetical protein GY762_18040 [Proteobacteria bacterium]|nr:hypothetical protein [Pseudomonadota bacterium]